jgi:hypothetical protein
VEGWQGERMPAPKGDALWRPPVGEPGPGQETGDRHHPAVTRGRHGREQRFRSGLHGAGHQDGSVLVHETDVHAPGMPVTAAVPWVWLGGEAPEILCRRTGHTHGAIVKLLEAFFTKKELFYDHSNPDPHDR